MIPAEEIKQWIDSAVSQFWLARRSAREKQAESGRRDQGERASVTSGRNMDGFVELTKQIAVACGIKEADVMVRPGDVGLPGFFRPLKRWDVVVVNGGQLVAALEFKSHIGPSFGNNFNNRCEEAIGAATDFWTSFRENVYMQSSAPFLGYLMLLENSEKSNTVVKLKSPHFPVLPEFERSSYVQRYGLLCHKLMKERLYSQASLILSDVQSDAQKPCSSFDSETAPLAFFESLGFALAAAVRRT